MAVGDVVYHSFAAVSVCQTVGADPVAAAVPGLLAPRSSAGVLLVVTEVVVAPDLSLCL